MKLGLEAKFTQNSDLKEQLLKTGELFLVESPPHDRYWGSGLSLHHENCLDMTKYEGNNIMGTLLMQVRDNLLVIVHSPSEKIPPAKRNRLKSPEATSTC